MQFRESNRVFFTLLLMGFFLVFSQASEAAPKAKLWSFWNESNEGSKTKVDHKLWSDFLARHVKRAKRGLNRVNYGAARRDRRSLDRYVESLARVRVRALNSREQLAYWINLYNALTIKVIIDHYPVKSIRDIKISPGLFASGPWGKKLIRIEGQEVSLDDIEHRILRPIWRDNRIHYAVNCASVGCPNLAATAYTPGNTAKLLDRGAENFINSNRGVAISRSGLRLSSIYDWFASDFGGSKKALRKHLLLYATGDRRAALKKQKIIGYDYDWNLNDAR